MKESKIERKNRKRSERQKVLNNQMNKNQCRLTKIKGMKNEKLIKTFQFKLNEYLPTQIYVLFVVR